MPLYEFVNTETEEVFEEIMSYDAKKQFLADNQHIKEKFSPIHYGDPFVHRPPKADSDYNSMLKSMKKFYDRSDKTSTINTF